MMMSRVVRAVVSSDRRAPQSMLLRHLCHPGALVGPKRCDRSVTASNVIQRAWLLLPPPNRTTWSVKRLTHLSAQLKDRDDGRRPHSASPQRHFPGGADPTTQGQVRSPGLTAHASATTASKRWGKASQIEKISRGRLLLAAGL
jgi:hypothetical protein